MKYQAKNLKAEAYIAYSKDAFNDEKQGLAYFWNGDRLKPAAGNKDQFDEILCAPIDAAHYIETALPKIDEIILAADGDSDERISMPMALNDWLSVDLDLIDWYNICEESSSGEFSIPVPEYFYEKWENYRCRSSSYKKKHPKPSVADGIMIENCDVDYFFKTSFFPPRAYAEIVCKKYIHVHGNPKLEWLAVPECVPNSDLELNDYIYYERKSALNLAIEISAALADYHALDTSYRSGDKTFYDIALFELKQRLLPDLLKFNAIYFRIAVARTFIYALRNCLIDRMNSGWEDADVQTQYRKIEAWVAQITIQLRTILYPSAFFPAKAEDISSERIRALEHMRSPIQFCDPRQISSTDKAYPKMYTGEKSDTITPTSLAIFCNPAHSNVPFYLDRIRLYRDDFGKAKEACGGTLKLPDILRCRDFKAEIFTEVYQAILAEMENAENN